ncbi:MAG: CoA ester lyase [Rhodococcus sp. (in: high G+C Gram-positive bacteria)]
MRPLRSLLFVPGHREGWAEKAVAAGVDGVILDLEDSVPEDLKDAGRAAVAKTIPGLRAANPDLGIYVRVNALETGLTGDDVAAVALPELDGFVIPKFYGPDDILRIDALVTHFERKNGVESGALEFIPCLESAQAYETCAEVVTCSPRVATLFAGTARDADVSRSIGFQFTPGGQETLFLRSRAVLACRANGKDFPLTGVWQDLQDDEGARAFAEQNRQLGFRGMFLIHPKHVDLANAVFSPSAEDVKFYSEMITAFDAAVADGKAAVSYEGMHVDYAHIKTARDVLAYAERLGTGV